jgi:molybdopterin molybdotransferase
MISVRQADLILKNEIHDFGTEEIHIADSIGRILKENIFADRNLPPFDRVSMDGIAIRFDDFFSGNREFTISAMTAAGSPQTTLSQPNHCIEVMTGCMLPLQSDTVIPYEWLSIENQKATVIKENVRKGQNVHPQGTDRRTGDLMIRSGSVITSTEIGVLSTVGKSVLKVSRHPKTIIISTGNELVEIENEPLSHQVRMSNAHQLVAALDELNISAQRAHLQDDFAEISNALLHYISNYDIIIISGGVSEGKFDFIPSALDTLGVEKLFYKISQRPGKPFWSGRHPNGCTIFALPGNPVSSFLCFVRYIKPWLENCLQKKKSFQPKAKLSEDVSFTPDLTYFMTVRLEQNENAETIAHPVKGHGSGDLSILTEANAFIQLPGGKDLYQEGEVFSVYLF